MLIEDLYNFWWWDELDYVIDGLQNHDTIEITVETILKTLRCILEIRRLCNYPTKAGSWFSMNSLLYQIAINIEDIRLWKRK